eukprot:GFUD01027756.1.p1 GENE.GFUD01027756.1~~GFUD01027756.1.p1  ORF type:complete len:498 (+),score=171.57 GFUD01027756.1:365-1858(+)
MPGRRPSRGTRVVYREVDSDEEEESDYETEDDLNYNPEDFEDNIYQTILPPLTPLQLELRSLCKLGEKAMLKTFLANNPEIDLDVRDPTANTTVLNEAVTKTAQFAEIVEMLVQAGAGLDVTDSLGNTPLHNAVLYWPSTQQTVDLLLEKGADVSAMNQEGSTPISLADDKELKIVLRKLVKVKSRKKSVGGTPSGYSDSPELRRKVFDRKLMEERDKQSIVVKYNSPVVVNSPGLLKRKREVEDLEESFIVKTKRIRFCEQDSTGADIDPQFSEGDSESEAEDIEQAENQFSAKDLNNDSGLTTVEQINIKNLDIKVDKVEKTCQVFEEKPEIPDTLAFESDSLTVAKKTPDKGDAESEMKDAETEPGTVIKSLDVDPVDPILTNSTPNEQLALARDSESPSSSCHIKSSNIQADCKEESLQSQSSSPKISSSPLQFLKQSGETSKQTSILKFFSPRTSSPSAPKILNLTGNKTSDCEEQLISSDNIEPIIKFGSS